MFKSLKHWIEAEVKTETLFQSQADFVRVALASTLYHIIKADGVESDREKHKFQQIMQHEFNLDCNEVADLYHRAQALDSNLHSDLNIIREYLQDTPQVRMALMNQLNQLGHVNGMGEAEVAVFQDAMRVMFPEVAPEKKL